MNPDDVWQTKNSSISSRIGIMGSDRPSSAFGHLAMRKRPHASCGCVALRRTRQAGLRTAAAGILTMQNLIKLSVDPRRAMHASAAR
jgi:hypothetical protein